MLVDDVEDLVKFFNLFLGELRRFSAEDRPLEWKCVCETKKKP